MSFKKNAAVALILLVMAVGFYALPHTTAIVPLSLREGDTLPSSPCKYSSDPEILLSAYWLNHSWFNTSRPVTLVLEENFTSDDYLHVNCSSSSNQSVAMSFNISSLGDAKVNFTGISLYMWRNGTDTPSLVVQLRNATVNAAGSPAPNVTIIEKTYSDIPSSPGWVTLLDETPITLNNTNTYSGLFFIVVYATVSDTTFFVWNATKDDLDGNDAGFALVNHFTSFDDLNDPSKWNTVGYDCWMNVSLMVYEGLIEFSLPRGWNLDYLFLDISDDTVLGSINGVINGLNGSFSVNVPGDRVYSAFFSFSDVVPGSVWTVLEDRMNSGGYSRIVGGMGEAQMFLLKRNTSGISISVPVANLGMIADLTAELRNATFNGNRWVPYGIIESVDVPSSSVPSNYSWITLNFTSNLSAGAYFLVLHTKDWSSSPNGGYYDWGSHMEGENEGAPEGGYEIWTTDNGNSWVADVRDPYGNRYWHCMKIAPNYTDWKILNDMFLAANGLLVCNDGSWNSSMWLTPINGNISVLVTAATQLKYDLTYTINYVNYTGNLSTYALYLNDTRITSMVGGGYTKFYTGNEINYNTSDGKVSFLVKLKLENNWVSENLTVFALAKLTFKSGIYLTGAEATYTYTHNGSIVFPEQQLITLYYPASYTVKNVSLNGSSEENWLDSPLNETTRKLVILKNETMPLFNDGSTLNLSVTFLPELNVTHGFSYVNEELTITMGNLLDNPEKVNVTIIFPNGSIHVSQFTYPGGSFNVTFTPNTAGKYVIRAVSQEGSVAYNRNFTSGYVYVFYVHELAVFFVQPQEKCVVGETYTVKVWIGYVPSSGVRNFSGNVTITANDIPLQYDQEAGLYAVSFKPESVGVLNLTVIAEDEEGHSANASLLIDVLPPEAIRPLSLLTAIITQVMLKHWELSQLNNQASAFSLLATLTLAAVIYLKPEVIERILSGIRRIKKTS
ncbi:MAG: hypothetical protein QXN15_01785 [Candidatus Jordarchaeales archaeon]|nr:hypothetical protein [Candidatus Jordarchaeia archaeon]